jgi:integrase
MEKKHFVNHAIKWEGEAWENVKPALRKSEDTKLAYQQRISYYMTWKGGKELLSIDAIVAPEVKEITKSVIDYISYLVDLKMKRNAILAFVTPLFTLCQWNDKRLPEKKIRATIPIDDSHLGEDRNPELRAYTRLEIQLMLDYAEQTRKKVMILLMASAGLRVGALPHLKKKHLTLMLNGTYQIRVYAGTRDQYYTFCTPECAKIIDFDFKQRAKHGETITDGSFVIREKYNLRKANGASKPNLKPLGVKALQTLIRQIVIDAGIHDPKTKPEGCANYDTATDHSFRRFFEDNIGSVIAGATIVQKLMGHKNLSTRYHTGKSKTTQNEQELATIYHEYEKAIHLLTINDIAREKAAHEVTKQKVKSQEETDRALQVMQNEILKLKKKKYVDRFGEFFENVGDGVFKDSDWLKEVDAKVNNEIERLKASGVVLKPEQFKKLRKVEFKRAFAYQVEHYAKHYDNEIPDLDDLEEEVN